MVQGMCLALSSRSHCSFRGDIRMENTLELRTWAAAQEGSLGLWTLPASVLH